MKKESRETELYNSLRGPVRSFEDLLGRILVKIEKIDDQELILYLSDKNFVRLFHSQSCCEDVYIEDICGDLNDLIGEPLINVEEVCNYPDPPKKIIR